MENTCFWLNQPWLFLYFLNESFLYHSLALIVFFSRRKLKQTCRLLSLLDANWISMLLFSCWMHKYDKWNHCFHFDLISNLHWIRRNLNVAIELESRIIIIIIMMNTSPVLDSTSYYKPPVQVWINLHFIFLEIDNINHIKLNGIWASVEKEKEEKEEEEKGLRENMLIWI